MKTLALLAWTLSGLMVLGTVGQSKPPELPTAPTTDGKVPMPAEVEHFEAPKPTDPKALPSALLDGLHRKYPLPNAGTVVSSMTNFRPDIIPVSGLLGSTTSTNQRAKEAFEIGETLFKSCKAQEARSWFKRVVYLAPETEIAKKAEARLVQTTVSRFGNIETAEPPFADKEPVNDLAAIQLQVLRQAAQQYRAAVQSGDQTRMTDTGIVLDAVLKQLK